MPQAADLLRPSRRRTRSELLGGGTASIPVREKGQDRRFAAEQRKANEGSALVFGIFIIVTCAATTSARARVYMPTTDRGQAAPSFGMMRIYAHDAATNIASSEET
jgi:hypothetical protein